MGADFPAGRSSSGDGLAVLGCIFLVGLVGAWLVAIGFLVHGAVTQDLWEVISAAVAIVVLLVIRAVLKAAA